MDGWFASVVSEARVQTSKAKGETRGFSMVTNETSNLPGRELIDGLDLQVLGVHRHLSVSPACLPKSFNVVTSQTFICFA